MSVDVLSLPDVVGAARSVLERESSSTSSWDSSPWSFSARAAGHVVELSVSRPRAPGAGGLRGSVSSFSLASRRRLFRRAAACDWLVLGPSNLFVTLTYPVGFPATAVAKSHLRRFRLAWFRRFGSAVGMWKLEYQRRGAPHFHLALACSVPVVEVRSWVAATWYEIVASGDLRHLAAGTECDLLSGSPAAYFAGYVGRYGSKEYQHVVPPDDSPGRFWGVWGLPSDWSGWELSARAFFQIRRALASYGRSRSSRRGFRAVGRVQGGWQFVDGSALLVLWRLLQFYGGLRC